MLYDDNSCSIIITITINNNNKNSSSISNSKTATKCYKILFYLFHILQNVADKKWRIDHIGEMEKMEKSKGRSIYTNLIINISAL